MCHVGEQERYERLQIFVTEYPRTQEQTLLPRTHGDTVGTPVPTYSHLNPINLTQIEADGQGCGDRPSDEASLLPDGNAVSEAGGSWHLGRSNILGSSLG
jgi:hypothetical protein